MILRPRADHGGRMWYFSHCTYFPAATCWPQARREMRRLPCPLVAIFKHILQIAKGGKNYSVPCRPECSGKLIILRAIFFSSSPPPPLSPPLLPCRNAVLNNSTSWMFWILSSFSIYQSWMMAKYKFLLTFSSSFCLFFTLLLYFSSFDLFLPPLLSYSSLSFYLPLLPFIIFVLLSTHFFFLSFSYLLLNPFCCISLHFLYILILSFHSFFLSLHVFISLHYAPLFSSFPFLPILLPSSFSLLSFIIPFFYLTYSFLLLLLSFLPLPRPQWLVYATGQHSRLLNNVIPSNVHTLWQCFTLSTVVLVGGGPLCQQPAMQPAFSQPPECAPSLRAICLWSTWFGMLIAYWILFQSPSKHDQRLS